MHKKPIAAGTSSFDLIDPDLFFADLPIGEGEVVLDLACGKGSYTLPISERVGKKGIVYAVDLWVEGIDLLRAEIERLGITNIMALNADVSRELSIEGGSVDLCLMATVLHDLLKDGTAAGAMEQATKSLRRGGNLAIVEFKKIDGPPGPPLGIRISPEEVTKLVSSYGFSLEVSKDIGPYNYLSLFRKQTG